MSRSLAAATWGARAAALFLFFPLVYLILLSVSGEPLPYRELADVPTLRLLGRTALLAAGSALTACVLGSGAAWVFERRAFPGASFLRLCALAALVISPVFQVAAWEVLAASGGVLKALFPFASAVEEPFPMRNAPFAAWILGLSFSPIFFFLTSSALRSMPPPWLEAGAVARGPWAVRLRLAAPLSAPWIFAGWGFTFPLAFLNYEVPRLLDVTTYPVLMQVAYGARNDPGAAFAVASPAFLLVLGSLCVASRWVERRGFALCGREQAAAPPGERRPAPGCFASCAFGAWWLLVAALPLGVLFYLAGSAAAFAEAFRTDGEKVAWGIVEQGAAAALAVAIAALLLLRRGPERRGGGLGSSLWLWALLALPGSLLAFSLMRFGQTAFFFPLYNSWWILVVASVCRFFPVAFFALAAHLRAVPRPQWEAAFLARGARERWLRVRLPLAAPGLTAAAVAFVLLSSQELSARVLLAPPGHEPLLVRIYNLIHYDPERATLAALALFHVASVLGLVGAAALLGRWLAAGLPLEVSGTDRRRGGTSAGA